MLSAKYGLTELDQVIDPYDETLADLKTEGRARWSQMVYSQLVAHTQDYVENFVFLAGQYYRESLIDKINRHTGSHVDVPLEGKGIGQQLQFLKRFTDNSIIPSRDCRIQGDWYR